MQRVARKRRRNDGPWRNAVLALRGPQCRACGDTAHPTADHIMPRAQGGPSVVENGGVLCGNFSRASPFRAGCHEAHTKLELLWRKEWLDPDQIEWLAEQGYVWWNEQGEPCGRGSRRFAPERSQNGAPEPGAHR